MRRNFHVERLIERAAGISRRGFFLPILSLMLLFIQPLASEAAWLRLSSAVPANGATNIQANSTVTLNFNSNLNCSTVNTTTVTINPDNGWSRTSCSGSQAVFAPTGQGGSTTYTVTIVSGPSGVLASNGNQLQNNEVFSYTTDAVLPSSAVNSPAAGAVYNLASTSPVTITGTASDNRGVSGIQVSTDGGSTWNSATCTGCGTASATWSYSWSLPTEQSTSHTIRSRATDTSGNVESPGTGRTVTVDRVRPTVSSTIPSNSGTNPVNSSVAINWNENVDCATVNTTNITISGGGWSRTSCSGSQAVFSTSGQSVGTVYTVTVSTNVRDSAGNAMQNSYGFSYTAVDAPPSSTITAPSNGTIYNLASSSPVTISGTATDNVAVSGVEVSTDGGATWNAVTSCTGCGTSSATWSYNWTLPPGESTRNIRSRATDDNSNVETPGAGINVTVDRIAPSISNTTPANGGTAVINSNVTITWSEDVDCTTVNTTNITINAGGWTRLSCSGSQAVFSTSGQSSGSSYTATVTTAVKDSAGNPMASNYQFSYATIGSMFTLPTVTPVSGSGTSGGIFSIANIQAIDGVLNKYYSPSGSYNENIYQEYQFNTKLCSSAAGITLNVLMNWQPHGATSAKLEVMRVPADPNNPVYTSVSLNTRNGSNSYFNDVISIPLPSAVYVNSLRLRFLAVGGSPQTDYFAAFLTFADSNVCILPDNFSYTPPAWIATYPHIIYGPAGSTINLTSSSTLPGVSRSFYADADMNGTKDSGTAITQITLPAGGVTGVVAEAAMPSDFTSTDKMTVTATLQGQPSNTRSATDVTIAPADGVKEADYSAPYASYEFFNYGLDPNMASGELYSYVKDNVLHVYYAQNPRNVNDNTYGANIQEGWASHTLGDLVLSDKTEFIFLDESGNVKLDFFSDYVDTVTASAMYPAGYHSLGFAGGDGSMVINNTGKSDSELASLMSVESSMAYNLNHFYNAGTGIPQVQCTNTLVNLLNDSPVMDPRYYYVNQTCPNAADYQMSYAIEMAIPIWKIFPNEPVINIVARAHNSPSKVSCKDCPPTISSASLGDYVWYDWNGDGIQDAWESGIPNVRVILYWDKYGDGKFSEKLAETRTDDNGYYLFPGLYGGITTNKLGQTIYSGDYKVVVDETTIPAGFTGTYPATSGVYKLSSNPLVAGANRGTLGTTEDCRSADFGYKPLGGMIGDFVWSDCKQNGIQDPGELGIANVKLELECVSLDSPVPPGLPFTCPNTNIATAYTNSQGRYFFTGASFTPIIKDGLPAGTYRVKVADSNFLSGGVLDGYAYSPGPESQQSPSADIHLPYKGVHLSADFAYWKDGVCGEIGNAVFFNADCTPFGGEDPNPTDPEFPYVGGYTGGDFGFSGVTVGLWRDENQNGLRDDTDPYLGSAVTDTNGGYLFWVPVTTAGISYIVQVTDNNNVLAGYDKWYPRSGLSTTLTTSNKTNYRLDFPYVAFGTIGDWVWNDLNHDGIQDSNEPGLAGITVSLERYDIYNGWIFQSQTVTDSQGKYLFTGLRTTDDNGNPTQYRVSVDDAALLAAGWSRSPQGQGGNSGKDSNNPLGSTTALGGVSCSSQNDLTIDFGYYNQNAVYGSIGDYIWLDANGNGLQDDGDAAGINGVTLELRDGVTDNVLRPTVTTTNNPSTGKSGWYSFEGLEVNKSYRVVVTDVNNKLAGYLMTTDPAVLNVTLPDATRDSTDNGRNVLDADAGYMPIPTNVRISAFNAYVDNGHVVVEWKTASETNTIGFNLLRLDEATGRYRKVNTLMVPALIGFSGGGIYRVMDSSAVPGGTYTYKILETEMKGAKLYYGPYEVTASGTSIDPASGSMVSDMSRQPNGMSESKRVRIDSAKQTRAAPKLLKDQRGSGIQIEVRESGLYFVSAADIASFLGLSTNTAAAMIGRYQLALTNQGQDIAYMPANGSLGMYFYGQAMDSVYTNRNVYRLMPGGGLPMKTVKGAIPGNAVPENLSFTETMHLEEDVFDIPAWASGPDSDYWFSDYLFSGLDGMDEKVLTLTAQDAAAVGSNATLSVNVQGLTDTEAANHHLIISLNGTDIGEERWTGTKPHSVTSSFSQSLLASGDNTVGVRAVLDDGVPYSIILIDSFDLTYQKKYHSAGDALFFSGDSNPLVTVTGFTSPELLVLDISDPKKPAVVLNTSVGNTGGGYALTLAPWPLGRYLAVGPFAVKTPAGERVYNSSALKSKSNSVDYLIITAGEFSAGVKPLADYRRSQGLQVMAVDTATIYDEFSSGIYSPAAIKDLLSYASANWKKAPRYVVLVGNGSYDYRDIYGYGDNFVPVMMVSTPDGLYPSDSYFTDINGDHIPDMAVGRLPVVSAAELSSAVNKIIGYETAAAGPWQKTVIMAADSADPEAGDFPADSDEVAGLLPAGYAVAKIYLSERPLPEARQLLLSGLNSGSLLFNYIGHGSMDQLAFDGLLASSDVDSLANGFKLPLVTAMTCYMNNFGVPGADALGEAMMLKNNGGSIAVWGPGGLSLNSEAVILDKKIFEAFFVDREKVLGAAVRKALEGYKATGGKVFMLDLYNLLGDPALRIR